MKLNMTFTITVETKRFANGEDNDAGENIDLDLTLNTLESGLFLFKISKNIFQYQDYKVLIMTDNVTGEAKSVSFLTDDYTYIVKSKNKFYSDILTGYEKIRLLEKLSAISEYAEFQSSAPSDNEILDEFDDNIEV